MKIEGHYTTRVPITELEPGSVFEHCNNLYLVGRYFNSETRYATNIETGLIYSFSDDMLWRGALVQSIPNAKVVLG